MPGQGMAHGTARHGTAWHGTAHMTHEAKRMGQVVLKMLDLHMFLSDDDFSIADLTGRQTNLLSFVRSLARSLAVGRSAGRSLARVHACLYATQQARSRFTCPHACTRVCACAPVCRRTFVQYGRHAEASVICSYACMHACVRVKRCLVLLGRGSPRFHWATWVTWSVVCCDARAGSSPAVCVMQTCNHACTHAARDGRKWFKVQEHEDSNNDKELFDADGNVMLCRSRKKVLHEP